MNSYVYNGDEMVTEMLRKISPGFKKTESRKWWPRYLPTTPPPRAPREPPLAELGHADPNSR
jgi:hypothetical protein